MTGETPSGVRYALLVPHDEIDIVVPGTRLGPWRVLRRLGARAPTEAFLAESTEPSARRGRAQVVLEMLAPADAKRASAIATFVRASEHASRIEHEHLVRVAPAALTGHTPYVVVEHVPGWSARDVLLALSTRSLKLEVPLAVALMVRALRGMHAVQRVLRRRDPSGSGALAWTGVVPDRIRISDRGRVKYAHFAVRWSSMTCPQGPVDLWNELRYAAPEKLEGAPGDERSDVYAAGVLLWELAVGVPLIPRSDFSSMAFDVARGLRPAARARARVPAVLESIVMRCLDHQPARRPADLDVLVDALLAACPAAASVSNARIASTTHALFAGRMETGLAAGASERAANERERDASGLVRLIESEGAPPLSVLSPRAVSVTRSVRPSSRRRRARTREERLRAALGVTVLALAVALTTLATLLAR